jgi:DNA topoisomerase IA
MKAIIAEKPSVAREIAQLLGAHEKKDGYYPVTDIVSPGHWDI